MNRSTLALKCGSFFLVLLLLVGCANIGKIEFDKETNRNITKIALLRVNEPEPRQLSVQALPFYTFHGYRVFPAITISGSSKVFSNEFRDAINYHYVQFAPAMVESLQEELAEKGYELIYLQDRSPINVQTSKTDDYSHIQTDADAFLIVRILWSGYKEWSESQGVSVSWSVKSTYNNVWFSPKLMLYAELFDSRSKRKIYSRLFCIQDAEHPINTEKLFPDEKYKYKSFDHLMNNFNEAIQGLKDCQSRIAACIADHLK